jgi:hypothetical protein
MSDGQRDELRWAVEEFLETPVELLARASETNDLGEEVRPGHYAVYATGLGRLGLPRASDPFDAARPVAKREHRLMLAYGEYDVAAAHAFRINGAVWFPLGPDEKAGSADATCHIFRVQRTDLVNEPSVEEAE